MVSRIAILAFALLGVGPAPAQSSLWRDVPATIDLRKTHPLTLTREQLISVHAALVARQSRLGLWDCEDRSWLDYLTYSTIQVAPRPVILIEAGRGCARGGQGSNGAMWLVAWNGKRPWVIASPDMNFNGWLYGVLPKMHNGFHDVVLGWHMSAFESNLTYFEFDGAKYKAVSSASLESDGDGNGKIIPSPGLPK